MAVKKPRHRRQVKSSRTQSVQRDDKPATTGLQAKPTIRKKSVAGRQGEANVPDVQRLLLAVTRLQALFIDEAKPEALFSVLLDELLTLTDSEYGFIGEVLQSAEGQPYLRTHVITDIAWNEETKALLAQHAPTLEFRNLKTLFGHVMTTGKPVIANDPAHDPRAGGLPPGHPPMHAFLGLPLYRKAQLMGMVGVANRPGGYDDTLVAYLAPFLETCAQLLEGYHHRQQRVKAEAALRESEERWHLAVRGSQDAIWDWDIQKGTVFYSARWKAIRGFEEQELTDSVDEWRLRIHPEDRDRVLQAVGAYLSKRSMEFWQEYRTQRKDGSYGWVLDRGMALWDEHGVAVRMTGSESDITERKLAEQALLEANTAVELVMEGIARLDESGHYVFVNHHYAALLGYRPEELMGQSWEITVHPDDRASVCTTFAEMMTTGKAETDLRGVKKDGSLIWKHVVVVKPTGNAGKIQGHFCFARDVTERKREEALQEAEKQALELVARGTSVDEVLAFICRTIETHTTRMLCSVMLVTEDGAQLSLAAGPSLSNEYNRAIGLIPIGPTVGSCGSAAHFKTPAIVTDIATDPLWKDYAPVALVHGLKACWSQPIFNSTGALLGTFAAYYREARSPQPADLKIVERASHIAALAIEHARMTQALRESEARFQAFMNYSPVVSFIKDQAGRHLYVNPSFERRFQVSFDQIRGKSNEELLPAAVAAELNENDRRVLSTGDVLELEETVPTPDGQSQHWLVLRFPLKGSMGEPLLGGVAIDITARKQAEEEQRRTHMLLTNVINTTPDLVFVKDHNLRTVLCNHTFSKLVGKEVADLVGHSDVENGWDPELIYGNPDKGIRGYQEDDFLALSGQLVRNPQDRVWVDGTLRVFDTYKVPLRDAQGVITGLLGISRDVTERKRMEDALDALARGTGAVIGHEFFPVFVKELAQALQVRYAGVCDLSSERPGYAKVRAMWNGEGWMPSFEYALASTPCGEVVRNGFASYPSSVRELFHEDADLVSLRAESYLGFLLRSGSGEPMGHIFMIDDKPMTDSKQVMAIMQIFAARAEAEMERLKADEALRESEQRFRVIADTAPALIWMSGLDKKCMYFNQGWLNYTGRTLEQELGDGWADGVHPDDFTRCLKIYSSAFDRHEPFEMEYRLRKTNGEYGWIHDSGVPRFLPDGSFAGYLGACIDITARKQAEEHLRRTQFAMDQAVDAVYWIDSHARILYANEAASAMLGYTTDEFLRMTVHDLNPEFPPSRWPGWWEETREKKMISLETSHLTKEGRRIPIDIRVSFLAHGGQEFHCAFVRDIAVRKQVEAARETLQYAVDRGMEGFALLDSEGRYTYMNESHAKLYGFTPSELIGHSWNTLYDADQVARIQSEIFPVLQSDQRWQGELVGRTRTGEAVHIEVGLQLLPQKGVVSEALLCTCRDITARKQVERALQQAHEELEQRVDERTAQLAMANRSLLEEIVERKRTEKELRLTQFTVDRAAQGIFWVGSKAEILYVNDAACDVLGYGRDELLRMTVHDFDPNFPPEAWPAHWEELKQRGSFTFESSQRTKKGVVRYTEVTVNYLEYDGQEYNCAIVSDITDRKQSEEAIRESELRYKLVTESTFDSIAIHDQGLLLEVNSGLERMFRYEPGELLGRSILDLVAEESRDLVKANMLAGVRGPYEAVGRRKDGSTFAGEIVVRPYRYHGKEVRLVAGRDITERKHLEVARLRYMEELERQVAERTEEITRLESQRAQTEKLAALGRLAAGVAHEINNPMAGIKNAFTLVRQAVDPAHPSAEFAGLIDREIARVSAIIQNMYQLCRPEARQAEWVELWALVKDLDVLLSPQLQQRRLKFIAEMENCQTPLCVPRGDLVQVLLNLLTNAIDSSPEGETITLSLGETVEWIRLAVRDQGAGVEPEHLPRIFDPFYTTKTGRDQKGMGLGLSVSQSLVQAMGGKIEVDTQPGRGSTFTVCLPRTLTSMSTSVQSNIIKEVVTHDR